MLAVLMALAAAAVALLASSGGDGIDPVNREDVQTQIEDLRQFLREHAR